MAFSVLLMMMMMMMMMMTKVNVEVVQRPVIFPSVTVCHKNHLDSLIVEDLELMLDGDVGGSPTASDAVEKFKRNYSEFSDRLTAFLKHSDDMTIMEYNYEIPEVSPCTPSSFDALSLITFIHQYD